MELKGWNAYHYRLPSFLGGRLDTRRLAVSSLLRAIRCQRGWISPATEYVTIPPTMASGDGTAVQVPVHQKDERSYSLGKRSGMTC